MLGVRYALMYAEIYSQPIIYELEALTRPTPLLTRRL
jgi:hypothetical protein